MKTQKQVNEIMKSVRFEVLGFGNDGRRDRSYGNLDAITALQTIINWTREGLKIVIVSSMKSYEITRYEVLNGHRCPYEYAIQFATTIKL